MRSTRTSRPAILGASVALLGIVAAWSALSGALDVPFSDVIEVLRFRLLGGPEPSDPMAASVIWSIRLPRIALAIVVGAALAVAGSGMQGVFRNPLADPGLVGATIGAALGASIAILALRAEDNPVPEAWAMTLIPACATVGAVSAVLIAYTLATRHGETDVFTLLLAGIAINAVAGAGIGFATTVADEAGVRDLAMWTLGSLGGATWVQVAIVTGATVLTSVALIRFAPALNAFLLGESEAYHLGVPVQRVKTVVVLLCSVAVGIAVSFSGTIGFVGLIVPHLIRLSAGPDHRFLIPAAAILGAALLVAADTLCRTVVAPSELPIGVMTAAVGGPFFLWLLLSQRGKGGF